MAARAREALRAVSERTGAPLPSLLLSFALLHEATAIIPLVGGFYTARALGVGETAVDSVLNAHPSASQLIWAQNKCKVWVEEGEQWAGRVGRRYGYFGFEKGASKDSQPPQRLSGDIANAIFAYGVTKALLPVRIGLSVYLSPAFSRRVVDPAGRAFAKIFKTASKS